MKMTGVGPRIGKPTLIYMVITIVVHYLTKPIFQITERYYSIIAIVGAFLVLLTIVMNLIGARKLVKAYKAKILMTDGLYKLVRNPMYAAYLLFLIPGISLLVNSWLVLTTVVIYFIVFQILIKEEYRYLEDKYGEEYKNYLSRVLIKFL